MLEQQTATSEVLQVISSSAGDLQPVFATMLEKAVAICEARFGDIYRWDGDALRLVANHNTPPAFAEERKRAQYVRPVPGPPGTSLIGTMLATKSVVHVADLAAERAYIERSNPTYAAAVELGGVRTILGCADAEGERTDRCVHPVPPGSSSLHRQADRTGHRTSPLKPSSPSRTRGCSTNCVSAPTDLSQRTADLTEALEQQTATSEVLQVISSSPGDLEPVFATMLEKAVRICDAKFGTLYLYDEGGLRLIAAHDVPAAFEEVRGGAPIRSRAGWPL